MRVQGSIKIQVVSFAMTLNSQQQAVVTTDAKTIAVNSTAGSGKTRTLVARIQHQVECGTDQQQIVCCVYTNAAAKVLSERLRGLMIHVKFVGTIHSLCLRTLGRHGHLIGYRRSGVTIATEEISDELLHQAAADLKWRGSTRSLLARETDDARLVWSEYEQRLRRNSMVDYRGALTEARRLLDLDAVLEAERIDTLLLDEAQDAADIDWSIYRAWPAARKIACFDSDQNIFQFRGSSARGCQQWAADAEAVLPLETCYRCAPAICMAANRLIAHNTDRLEKTMYPVANIFGGEVTARQFADCAAEREYVVTLIRTMLATSAPASEIAVLTRTNHLAQQFREALHAASVPLSTPVKRQLPDDWRHAMNCLTLIADPRNDVVAERVLRVIAPDCIMRCKEWALARGEWLSRTSAMPPIVEADAVSSLHTFGVSKESRLLIRERHELLPSGTISDLLSDLGNPDGWQAEREGSGVWISTVHGSKGGEWDVVFAPAFEQGCFPMLKSSSEIESERCLAYVCVSRARSELRISWAANRVMQWGPPVERQTSQFIAEMGLTDHRLPDTNGANE